MRGNREYKAVMELTKDPLKDRWVGHEKGLEEIIPIIRSDPNWYKSEAYKTLMDELNPLPSDFGVVVKDLMGAPLSKANLEEADLSETFLWDANLSAAHLSLSDLSRSDLRRANLSGAGLVDADLSGANLFGVNLAETILWKADLSRADLSQANLSGAKLWRANLSGANLEVADLSGADLTEAKYTTDEVFNRLVHWRFPNFLRRIPILKDLQRLQEWKPVGITKFEGVDTTKVRGSTNPVLKRHIEDYQFIRGFKNKSWLHRWVFYWLWKVTSDCGRSLLLWLIWSVIIVGLFTLKYIFNLGWFTTTASKLTDLDWFNALYFSVITFTTLGFGDVTAKLDNRYAQGWVMAEVIIGYIMLGGLISILANKLARRA